LQVPLAHAFVPLQHGGMPAPHALPSEVQPSEEHMPLVQLRLQQSVGCVQPPPLAHVAVVHNFAVGSHVPEQHWLPIAQAVPPLKQVGPPPALRSLVLLELDL
jgi:hypothetical protein